MSYFTHFKTYDTTQYLPHWEHENYYRVIMSQIYVKRMHLLLASLILKTSKIIIKFDQGLFPHEWHVMRCGVSLELLPGPLLWWGKLGQLTPLYANVCGLPQATGATPSYKQLIGSRRKSAVLWEELGTQLHRCQQQCENARLPHLHIYAF